jgi:hypothetical protein
MARVTEPGGRAGGGGVVPSGATRTADARTTGAHADALRVLAKALVAMRQWTFSRRPANPTAWQAA